MNDLIRLPRLAQCPGNMKDEGNNIEFRPRQDRGSELVNSRCFSSTFFKVFRKYYQTVNRTTCYAVHIDGVRLQELIFNTLPPVIPSKVIGYPGVVAYLLSTFCCFKINFILV